MGSVKRIRNSADFDAALVRIDELMGASPGTPEGDELDVLVDLVELYEAKHVPMGHPTAIAAIEFRMDQAGLTPRDLVPFIGSRAKVSEVLSGKRALTMAMARALHEHLGIPAESLLQDRADGLSGSLRGMDWSRFPIASMVGLGWISKRAAKNPEKCMGELIRCAGGLAVAEPALYRKNDHARLNAKSDPYALKAWCWKVLATASQKRPATPYRPGTISLEFLRAVARLSWSDEGPRLAKEFLEKHGVPVAVVRHLPKTYLDGAALRLGDGTPVIGLSLRYDRLDNFWFCLLHELAHIGRHMDDNGTESFVDDLSLRPVSGGFEDPREAEADEWAEEALVPSDIWETSSARLSPSPSTVLSLAKALGVHPAIVAGRVRHERKNYRMLSHFVGTGEVRRLFC